MVIEPAKLVNFTYSVTDGLHKFASADGSIVFERRDPERAARRVVQAILELPDGPFYFQVEELTPMPLVVRWALGRDQAFYTPPTGRRFTYKRARTKVTIAHVDLPSPMYATWDEYLTRTTYGERMKRCHAVAKKSNRRFPHRDGTKITGKDIWGIIAEAKGRCVYCRSLAVENRPSHPETGAPVQWAHMGRRIGSLEHKDWVLGRNNDLTNLAWACLWCNTEPGERIPFSEDFGGHYPE